MQRVSASPAEDDQLMDQLAAAALEDFPRRLVLCLDGTWNHRESGTNIYNLSNLVQEGLVGSGNDRWFQITAIPQAQR